VPPCETVCPEQDRRECIGIARGTAANAEVRGSRSVLRSDIRFRTASTPVDRRRIADVHESNRPSYAGISQRLRRRSIDASRALGEEGGREKHPVGQESNEPVD